MYILISQFCVIILFILKMTAFTSAFSLCHQSEYGGSTHLRNISPLLRDYTALHPRRVILLAAVRV
jgi:hypothetical protein